MLSVANRTRKLQLKLVSKHITDPDMPLHKPLRRLLHQNRQHKPSALSAALSNYLSLNIPIPPAPPSETSPLQIHPFLDSLINTRLSKLPKKSTPNEVYIQSFLDLLSNFQFHSHVYTDASKSMSGTGIAIVNHTPGQNTSTILSTPLHSHCPNYIAELTAIWLATSNPDLFPPSQPVVIFTDSLSAVQAIRNAQNKDYLCRSVRNNIIKRNISLCWVPGHAGIMGNDLADKAAKIAANDHLSDQTIPPSALLMYQAGIRKLQESFRNASTFSPHYLSVNPSITSPSFNPNLGRSHQVSLLRLRIGHTRLTHSHYMSREPSPVCRFCNDTLTVSHTLLNCNKSKHFLLKQTDPIPSLKELLSPAQDPNSPLFKLLRHLGYQGKI